MNPKEIKISEYTYNLPDERIAKYPLPERDNSNLLVYKKGDIQKKNFKNVSSFFSDEDLLIFNNTKVIQARIHFRKETGAKIEIFCLEPIEPSDYVLSFQANENCKWKCIVGNSKKWKEGSLKKIINVNNQNITLVAKRIKKLANAQIIEFSWENREITFSEILENIGQTPIPPYLNRKSEESDKNRYQTVYSQHKGSVAAPTAGLHFTENIIENLRNKGAETANVTLHVGAGTFKPVKSETIDGHEMHTEHFFVTKQTIEKLLQKKEKITAVGTTSVRTIESIYWLGVKLLTQNKFKKLLISQWEVYDLPQTFSCEDSLNAILEYFKTEGIETLEAATQIIIVPGYNFKIVNQIITNFHQPQSTLLLLIAAFIGENWKKVYDFAMKNNFRFLSYGDSSILIP